MIYRYRITGMVICLMLIVLAGALLATRNEFYIELASLLTMFVGGYGLRETMDHIGESEE